ncbi:hypothetical protein BGZ51_009197, partial [Haplosporangium sp. Z 767]
TPEVDPRSCLVDPVGAIFGLSVLASSLICLIGTSFAHVSVWIVTGPFALLTLIRDIWYDSQGKFKGPGTASLIEKSDTTAVDAGTSGENRMEQGVLPEIAVPDQSIVHPTHILGDDNDEKTFDEGDNDDQQSVSTTNSAQMKIKSDIASTKDLQGKEFNKKQDTRPLSRTESARVMYPANKRASKFERKFPLLHAIAIRMPWAILPFTFSMFIMVEGLSHSGWIAIFANWATKLVPNYIAATYAIGFISVLLCNIFNNVPMTILVARILQHPNFVNSPLATPEVVKGCLFGLIVGSNLGACTTLISSLAGLMWDSVLRSKNSGVGFWPFFKWNMGVMPMVILVALSVVVIELAVIY